jgi:DNA mismatch repair protein MutS2
VPTTEKSLATLEYDKVIERLARHASTDRGRALALVLQPSPEYAEVLHRQRLTAEARRLLELNPRLSLSDVRDIASLVQGAAIERILEPAELLDVEATLSSAGRFHAAVEKVRAYMPLIAEISDRIDDFRDLTAEVSRCINGKGEVADSASPALARLRKESRVVHDRLRSRLEQIVNSGSRTALQEPIITLRDGRYVVPVKAEMRSSLPGIVHDVSSSGATVFLEPLETVEMGNRWREMLAEEEREIARILRDLSARVGRRSAEIGAALDALAEIDLLLAKVRLGEAMNARQIPHDGPDQAWLEEEPGSLYLRNARHPLIGEHVVPINIWLGTGGPASGDVAPTSGPEDFTVLLITGPNTGGKTVALKTVGLLSLMAAAGLPVPAGADSRLPVCDAVFADIGDEQSIEQSLSTFSSHIGNIIDILNKATHRSLVLLDELAAGTDPVEGSALAKAVLSRLLAIGCLTVATTHHGELKAYAHTTPGITNASVEFDPDSLAPTYRLHIGLPGQSNALAIAERLGMPQSVLEEARAGVDPDRLAVESLIADLHRHREEAEVASETKRAAAAEAEVARDRVTKELRSLEANRNRLLEQTRREMEIELQQARASLREAVRDLQREERMTVFERQQAIAETEAKVEAVEATVKKIQRRERRPRRGPLPPIEPGDRVYLTDVPTPGEAITAPGEAGELEVKLGALRATVNVSQIANVEKTAFEPARPPVTAGDGPLTPSSLVPEVDLRGLTVDEALVLVDERLDEAVRAGVSEMRVIHGKGTGTLRRAIRDMLAKHALVQSQAPAEQRAGGDGVTVVELVR